MNPKLIAETFGKALDADDFQSAKTTLHSSCQYIIGDQILLGPEDICASYENNMIAGRKKLDELEWGQSRIEEAGDGTYFVHFTDYLTHKNQAYTHRCKQRLTIADDLIVKIEHIHDEEEQQRLNAYYRSVGLM